MTYLNLVSRIKTDQIFANSTSVFQFFLKKVVLNQQLMVACPSFCNSQEKFPKAQVDIYITVLENDGNGQSVGMTTAFCCTKVQESVVGSVNAKMSWNGQNDFKLWLYAQRGTYFWIAVL